MNSMLCSFCEQPNPIGYVVMGNDEVSICKKCCADCASLCVDDNNEPVISAEYPDGGVECEFCNNRNSNRTPILTKNDHAICIQCLGLCLGNFLVEGAGSVPSLIGRSLFRF